MEKIGLIAGSGKLPREFVESARKKGVKVVSVGVEGITDFPTDYSVPLGRVGTLLKVLSREGVKKLVMLGKFEHRLIYRDLLSFDLTAISLLAKARDRRPETLVRTFMDFLEEKGFRFVDPTPFLEDILAGEGLLNRTRPSEEAMEDGLFGFGIAKTLASLDIGQTVVVKKKAVVAVEAMEGTSETIRRAGTLAGKKTRVVKVARKNQDMRIDVPAVGVETLEVMKEAGADALFLESGKVFILEKERFLRLADRYGIGVVGLKG
ncbi:MAG: LpxI family protein [Aquificae bacterium]|nr:LpxI family protein [Aquificota bacterium]